MEAGRLYQLCAADCIGDCRCWPCRSACWTGGRRPPGRTEHISCPPDWLAAADAEDVLLHSVLHAMLGHPWTRGRRDAARWIWRAIWRRSFCVSGRWTGRSKGCTRRRFCCGDGAAYSARSVYARLKESSQFRRTSCARRSGATVTNIKLAAHARAAGGASGEGLAAVWKRQEGKLHPLMQPHRPKIGPAQRTRGSIFRSCPTIRRGSPRCCVRFPRCGRTGM